VLAASPIIDQKGRLYFQSFSADLRALAADSAPILRLDPASKRIDTAGYFRPQKLNVAVDGGKVRVGGMVMFAPEEAWTATDDGRVVRAVPEPYHLVYYGPAAPKTTAAIPYDPIKVTEADKADAKRNWERGMATGRAAAAQAAGRNAPQLAASEPTFAATKPPFLGRAALSAAPNGEVWVERSQRRGDAAGGIYDRFDPSGKRLAQIRLGSRSRVIGFGTGTVYVVRRDQDDLQYLERYQYPVTP